MTTSLPIPAFAHDAPLTELCTAELFVVASTRLWVAAYCNPMMQLPDWRQGFRAAAITGDGERSFDRLFAIVADAALRGLDIRCPRCPAFGADEARLLHLVRLLQGDRGDDAAAILSEWLPPAAMRLALPNAAIFARSLAESRLWIPLREARDAGAPNRIASVHANRGLLLVQ